jgi:hypothetical protein
LVFGILLFLLGWITSTGGLRAAPRLLQSLVTVLLIFAAVRFGLAIAIIAFDLSPLSILIPVGFGVLAWWLRPWRSPNHQA